MENTINGPVNRSYLIMCGLLDPVDCGLLSVDELSVLVTEPAHEKKLLKWFDKYHNNVSQKHWEVLIKNDSLRLKRSDRFPQSLSLQYCETALCHLDHISIETIRDLIKDIRSINKHSVADHKKLTARLLSRVREEKDIHGFVSGMYENIFSVRWVGGGMDIEKRLQEPLVSEIFFHNKFQCVIDGGERGAVYQFLSQLFSRVEPSNAFLQQLVKACSLNVQASLIRRFPNAFYFADFKQLPEHIKMEVIYRHQGMLSVCEEHDWDDTLFSDDFRRVAAARWYEELQTMRPLSVIEMEAALQAKDANMKGRIERMVIHTYPVEIGHLIMRIYYDDQENSYWMFADNRKVNDVLNALIIKNGWQNEMDIAGKHFVHRPSELVAVSEKCEVGSKIWDLVVMRNPESVHFHPSYPDIKESVFDQALLASPNKSLLYAHPKYRQRESCPQEYESWVYKFINEHDVDLTEMDRDFQFSDETVIAVVTKKGINSKTFLRLQTPQVVKMIYQPGMLIDTQSNPTSPGFELPFVHYIDEMEEEFKVLIFGEHRQRVKHLRGELLLEGIKRQPALITIVKHLTADIAMKALPFARTESQKRKLMRVISAE